MAIGSFRHAGMDCRHPGPQDASGDIHVNLDSSDTLKLRELRAFVVNAILGTYAY